MERGKKKVWEMTDVAATRGVALTPEEKEREKNGEEERKEVEGEGERIHGPPGVRYLVYCDPFGGVYKKYVLFSSLRSRLNTVHRYIYSADGK